MDIFDWLLPWLCQVGFILGLLLLLWLGIGFFVSRGLNLLSPISFGPGSLVLTGLMCGSYVTAFDGIVFQSSHEIVLVLAALALLGFTWAVFDRKTRVQATIPRIRQYLRTRWDYVFLAALIFVAFVPILLRGAAYWTLGSNDFPWFLGHLDVWRVEDLSEYRERFPGPYGAHMVSGAYTEKPVSTAVLLALTWISGGLYARVQTPFFLVTVALTAFVLMRIVRNFSISHPVARTLLVAGATVGLYPWARVLHGQVGHVLSVLFLVTALMWVQASANSHERNQRVLFGILAGLSWALAFGANAEVVTLTFVSVVAVGWILVRTSHDSAIERRVSLSAIALSAAICTAPFVPGALDVLKTAYLAIPTEILLTMRPSIPPPSPFAFLGLQISYESFTEVQNLLLWILTTILLSIGVFRLARGTRLSFMAPWLAIIANSVVVSAFFGQDNYVSGKFYSALIVIVAAPLIMLLMRLPSSWFITALAVAAGFTAVAVSLSYSTRLPFVIPRDLAELESDPILEELNVVNIRLGNYYEDAMAAMVIPTGRILLNDPIYTEGTVDSSAMTLVRLNSIDGELKEVSWPLNETYGLIPAHLPADLDPQ